MKVIMSKNDKNLSGDLSTRVTVILFSGLIGAILAVGVLIFGFVGSDFREAVIERQEHTAIETMAAVDMTLYHQFLAMEALGREFSGSLTDDEYQAKITDILVHSNVWNTLRVIDGDGIVIASSEEKEVETTLSNPFIASVLADFSMSMVMHSDMVFDAMNKPIVQFAIPTRGTRSSNQVAVVGDFSWENIVHVLRNSDKHATLVNAEGVIIAHNITDYAPHNLFLQDIRERSFVRDLLAGSDKTRVVLEGDGFISDKMLVSLAPQEGHLSYRGNAWGLVVQSPTTRAFGYTNTRLLTFFGESTIAIIFLWLFMLLLLTGGVIRPLSRVVAGAQRMITGDGLYRIKVRSDNEIGRVAQSLNLMADKMEVLVADLKKEKEITNTKDDFILFASHQLRTHLSSVKLFSELLSKGGKGKLTKIQKEYVDIIMDSTEQMIILINNLLNVSRVEVGSIQVMKSQVALEDIIKTSIDAVTPLAKKQKCSIVFNTPPEALAPIMTDKILIRQVITNFIENAIFYSPEKQCSIVVNLQKEDDSYKVSVTDEGAGIPESARSKIFQKFFRAENVLEAKSKGSGLGLYIAKMIIGLLGGEIGFSSIEGKGTTFYFTLPSESGKDNSV